MTSATAPGIRPYHPADRPALDDICIRTAHVGQDSRPLAFVLDDGRGQAVGYIVGTADTPRFVEDYRARRLPLVADRYPKTDTPARTPDEEIIPLLHRSLRAGCPVL